MHNESWLKAEILSRGVEFTMRALKYASDCGAKMQNMCYNAPKDFTDRRPAELCITGHDGYNVVVSCVAPTGNSNPVRLDSDVTSLFAEVDDHIVDYASLDFVPQPRYYNSITDDGFPIKDFVSACGADELNIIPWRGCQIRPGCLFCGINVVTGKNTSVLPMANKICNRAAWDKHKSTYLKNLAQSLEQALSDPCYSDHFHAIMISGNLSNLDFQADIYAEIASAITPILYGKDMDQLVAVITPPKDINRLKKLKISGIDVVVFNKEISNKDLSRQLCPGKFALGENYFNERLQKSVPIFGTGNVWCNFVFGFEPIDILLADCLELAKRGIVAGANVYHRDHGSHLTHRVPHVSEIIDFYCRLSEIYKSYKFKPYYCAQALRTSLANEAFSGRLDGFI